MRCALHSLRTPPLAFALAPSLAGVLLAVAPTAAQVPSTHATPVQRRVAVMGTWFELGVLPGEHSRDEALAASERALEAVQAVEARLSTWGPDSELARLNRAPVGEWFALSAETTGELEAALAISAATDGAFDPGVGGLVQAWKLREGGGARPTDEALAALVAVDGARALELDPVGRRARRTHAGLTIEEGGFGKGAGLDAARRALEAAGFDSGWLNLGGQLSILGEARANTFAIAHPTDRRRPVLYLRLDGGSVATSGNSERGITVDGERLGHLLDPRTGRPAPDFGSLTVWAEDALRADCLSTGLYVLGPERALEWAAAHDGVEVVVVEVRGDGTHARATAGLEGRLVHWAGGATLEFVLASPSPNTAPVPPGQPSDLESDPPRKSR